METRQGKGCFFYGCLATLALVLIGGGLSYYALNKWVTNFQEKYTQAQPRSLPVVDLPQEDIQAIQLRWQAFQEALESPQGVEASIVLSALEVNALIQNSPECSELKDKVYVEIEGDEIRGEVSWPLKDLPGFSDTYFNGSGIFDVSIDEGILKIFLVSAEVRGEPIPEDIMRNIQAQNLAENITDPGTLDKLRLVELVIENGNIVIQGRSAKF